MAGGAIGIALGKHGDECVDDEILAGRDFRDDLLHDFHGDHVRSAFRHALRPRVRRAQEVLAEGKTKGDRTEPVAVGSPSFQARGRKNKRKKKRERSRMKERKREKQPKGETRRENSSPGLAGFP